MPYDPFWMFRLPLSGDVSQRISAPWLSPALTINYAGNAEIEDHVVTEVASYGKQIGWLNEIVLAIADNQTPNANTINRLENAVKEIDAIKQRHARSTMRIAVEALDKLQTEQPSAYDALLRARM